jgi:hypothetical protein
MQHIQWHMRGQQDCADVTVFILALWKRIATLAASGWGKRLGNTITGG